MKTCPYCAVEIQDAAIKCRYCGSDLTITTGNAPDGARQPLRVAALTQEKEYFKDDQTLITSRRAILNYVTYAMSNITSVALATHQEKMGCFPFILFGSGAGLASFGFAQIASAGLLQGSPLVILGLLATIGAVRLMAKPDIHYIVRIHSGSGETDALQGRNLQLLQPIVDAINQAIAERQ